MLQAIANFALVRYNKTVIMTIYYQIVIKFVKVDLFSGEDLYSSWFKFKETLAYSYAFELFGIDN